MHIEQKLVHYFSAEVNFNNAEKDTKTVLPDAKLFLKIEEYIIFVLKF
jgi:hypothetical protein